MSVSTSLTIGANVKILTANKEVDPNEYTVKNIQGSVVFLTCVRTGQTIKVHSSRIVEIVNTNSQENQMSTETVTVDDTSTSTSTPKATKPKAPKQPKEPKQPKAPKPAPEQVNFQAMVDAGKEVWTKTGLSLGNSPKVSDIKVAAHCVISQDKTSYEVFNTYGGTLGKNGSTGKVYQFNEKLTLDKKRNNLRKDGYVQFGASPTSTTQAETSETTQTQETPSTESTPSQ